VFNVLLPTGVYNFTPRHDTYTGNFLFGILTAILSTPCTFGMFLGLLIWAVVQPAWIGTSLVMTVGLGMALPYFILSALPEIARKLPRSGPWNETIKQMMGFLLLASAVYFGRRFYASFITDSIFWWLMFAIIAAAGVFLVIKTLSITRRPVAIGIAAFVAALIIAPSLWATLRLTYVPIKWQPYTAEALADARAAGRPVLVKFTAAWCGNCQALEATVFVQDSVVQTVEANNVLMLKADLTDERAPGWSLLTTLNPVGAIPFTAIYLPQADEPLRLSGIYSTQDLLNALHQ
jgi:thiol:disulfide interchange protein